MVHYNHSNVLNKFEYLSRLNLLTFLFVIIHNELALLDHSNSGQPFGDNFWIIRIAGRHVVTTLNQND